MHLPNFIDFRRIAFSYELYVREVGAQWSDRYVPR
jgi:hypothetical protein